LDKAVKVILNSLKCPICKSQVDLYDYMAPRPKSIGYNFSCVAEYYHYRMWFPHWDSPALIDYDQVEVFEGRFRYRIDQYYTIGRTVYPVRSTSTIIEVQVVDGENHIIEEIRPKIFQYNKILFNWSTTNRDKIINRVKTILTFQ
jgi:hypothetical protein